MNAIGNASKAPRNFLAKLHRTINDQIEFQSSDFDNVVHDIRSMQNAVNGLLDKLKDGTSHGVRCEVDLVKSRSVLFEMSADFLEGVPIEPKEEKLLNAIVSEIREFDYVQFHIIIDTNSIELKKENEAANVYHLLYREIFRVRFSDIYTILERDGKLEELPKILLYCYENKQKESTPLLAAKINGFYGLSITNEHVEEFTRIFCIEKKRSRDVIRIIKTLLSNAVAYHAPDTNIVFRYVYNLDTIHILFENLSFLEGKDANGIPIGSNPGVRAEGANRWNHGGKGNGLYKAIKIAEGNDGSLKPSYEKSTEKSDRPMYNHTFTLHIPISTEKKTNENT